MAAAAVEERELLKSISWFDGFVVALANPSFLITSLGGSVLQPGRLGRRHPVDRLGGARRASQLHLLRDRNDVPQALRRHRDLRPRGVEAVLLVHRADRRLRLLDRLVGRALGDRRRGRLPRPVRVVSVLWRGEQQLEPQLADPWPDRLLQLPDCPDSRHHHDDLDVQRPGHASGGVGRLYHRRAAHDPARRHDVPALPDRRLAQLEPAQQHQRHRRLAGLEQLHADHRLAVRDVLVGVRDGVLRHLCARVPRHRPRHAEGATRGGHLRRHHLRPAADGRDGHVRRPEHDADQHLHVHARNHAHPARRLPRGARRLLALRRHRPGHEHGHRGRVAGALRHLAGRHDHQMAGQAQPLPCAGKRDDPGCGAEPDPALHLRLRPVGSDQDPDLLEPRLRDLPRLRHVGLPAPAQGSPKLAAADQGQRLWVPLAGALAAFDALLLVWGGWNSGLAWGDTSKTIVFEGIGVLCIAAVLYVYPGGRPGQAQARPPDLGARDAGRRAAGGAAVE